jgi:hypothetical protein
VVFLRSKRRRTNVKSQSSLIWSEATARYYKKALDELVYFFENNQIADITVQEAYRFVEYLRFDKRQYRGVRGNADNSKVYKQRKWLSFACTELLCSSEAIKIHRRGALYISRYRRFESAEKSP